MTEWRCSECEALLDTDFCLDCAMFGVKMMRWSSLPGAVRKRCGNGHEANDENLRVRIRNGVFRRECMQCIREYNERRRKQRSVNAPPR